MMDESQAGVLMGLICAAGRAAVHLGLHDCVEFHHLWNVAPLRASAMTKSKIIAVTVDEGGEWLKFGRGTYHHFHSILFEDGSTIDAWNGWRPDDNGRMPPWVDTTIDGTGWAEAAFDHTYPLTGNRPCADHMQCGWFSDDVDPAQRETVYPPGMTPTGMNAALRQKMVGA